MWPSPLPSSNTRESVCLHLRFHCTCCKSHRTKPASLGLKFKLPLNEAPYLSLCCSFFCRQCGWVWGLAMPDSEMGRSPERVDNGPVERRRGYKHYILSSHFEARILRVYPRKKCRELRKAYWQMPASGSSGLRPYLSWSWGQGGGERSHMSQGGGSRAAGLGGAAPVWAFWRCLPAPTPIQSSIAAETLTHLQPWWGS